MSESAGGRVRLRKRARLTRRRSDVGYGRPPKEHQFKPGKSGNPKGRPAGTKNEATILLDIMNRRIEIREGGKVRKTSVLYALLLKYVEDALKGNPKSATFLLNRYRLVEDQVSDIETIDRDDKEILEEFTQRLEQDLQAKSKKA